MAMGRRIHLAQIVAGQQRRSQHRSEAHVRAVFIAIHARRCLLQACQDRSSDPGFAYFASPAWAKRGLLAPARVLGALPKAGLSSEPGARKAAALR